MQRQIKLKTGRGQIETSYISGVKNPCGCGSNCFHKENTETETIGVCNACNKDIYKMEEKEVFEEYKLRED